MNGENLLLAFYGDDFTGSTDAMEALAKSGFRTVLFLEVPKPESLKKFEGLRCIGVAGTSRAKPPVEMEKELRPVMESLSKTGARIVHYKTCSTFDSSPEVGSIGHAILVSREYFGEQTAIPLLVGAPALGRYTLFGSHYAKFKDEVYRLDRHPVMSRHPITPMKEADLRVHLKEQLHEEIGLLNILELEGEYETVQRIYHKKREEDVSVVLLDVLDNERLEKSGQLIWETDEESTEFVVGSSGVEYALTAHWKKKGISNTILEKKESAVIQSDQILVVSGSCSSISQQQIEQAIKLGFCGIKVPLEHFFKQEEAEKFIKDVIEKINKGMSVVLYTALGPDDELINETRVHFQQVGMKDHESSEFMGRQLGKWTKQIIEETSLQRVVIAGGDTSGFVTSEMGIYALEMILAVSPGAPLCRVYSEDKRMNGIELALKGGQFGGPDYFQQVRDASSGK